MAKGIYINTGEDVELINFKKVDEILKDYDSEKLLDKLTIYFNNDEAENNIVINDVEYGLPALIKIKGKPSQYLVETLLNVLEKFETEEIYIDEDDFYEDDFEKDEDMYEEDFSIDDSDY